jgi:hypothetical protein
VWVSLKIGVVSQKLLDNLRSMSILESHKYYSDSRLRMNCIQEAIVLAVEFVFKISWITSRFDWIW